MLLVQHANQYNEGFIDFEMIIILISFYKWCLH